jgi:hypothetical protein
MRYELLTILILLSHASDSQTRRPDIADLGDLLQAQGAMNIGEYRVERRFTREEWADTCWRAVLLKKGQSIARCPEESHVTESRFVRFGLVPILSKDHSQLALNTYDGGNHGFLGYWIYELGENSHLIFDKSMYTENDLTLKLKDLDEDGTYEILLSLYCPLPDVLPTASERAVESELAPIVGPNSVLVLCLILCCSGFFIDRFWLTLDG